MKRYMVKFDIMAVADLCMDILITSSRHPQFNQVELLADDYALDLGGSVGIFATQFARLGGSISLTGKVGEDIPGRILLQKLKETGVETDLIEKIRDKRTSMGLNLYCQNDRAMFAYLGVMDLNTPALFTSDHSTCIHSTSDHFASGDLTNGHLTSADLTTGHFTHEHLLNTRHWHIGGYFLLKELIPGWPAWLKQLKEKEISISLDTNWDPSGKWDHVLDLLPQINVFLPNEAEALAISGKEDIDQAGSFLAKKCPLVVIKMGEKGALVFAEGKKMEFLIPDWLLTDLHIVDTTGAGDNFDAGFLYGWLAKKEIKDCIELGFCCAISSLKALGGIEGQFIAK